MACSHNETWGRGTTRPSETYNDLGRETGEKEDYVLIPAASMVDDQCRELDSTIGKALLSLLDTNYKCVILLSNGENNCAHVMNHIKNLFNKVGIDENRYCFALIN